MLVSYMKNTALFYHLEQLKMKYVHLIDEIETITTLSCQLNKKLCYHLNFLCFDEIMNVRSFIKIS